MQTEQNRELDPFSTPDPGTGGYPNLGEHYKMINQNNPSKPIRLFMEYAYGKAFKGPDKKYIFLKEIKSIFDIPGMEEKIFNIIFELPISANSLIEQLKQKI